MSTEKTYKDDIIFWLDWSTRHLKNLQRQYPPEEEHYNEAIYMFGIMKVCCDMLKINVLEWCKAVDIPYKRRYSDYKHLFREKEKFDILGKPMLRSGIYNKLILEMINTDKQDLEINLTTTE